MNLNLPDELKHCTGKGVKVAVIDSGIDLNSTMAKNVKAGIGIGWDGEKAYIHNDIQDENGHGSRICQILLFNAPQIELYIAKIFEKRLLTDMKCLVAGLEWAVDKNVHIINVSLGTTSQRDLKELRNVCTIALKKKAIIVSSLSNGNRRSYPGWFSGVLCVFNETKNKIKMKKIHLMAFRISKTNFVTNSFLVPIITSATALIQEYTGDLNHKNVLSRLDNFQFPNNNKEI